MASHAITSLMDQRAVRKRIQTVHAQMQQRAKPKRWKSGKRAGSVRKPGIDRLPFSSGQLYDFMLKELGPTTLVRCPYCVAAGRSATMLDAGNGVFDHIEPVSRGGAYTLQNLRYVCRDCNQIKGGMSLDFFILLVAQIDRHAPPGDREYVFACLRTHGQVVRSFGSFGAKKGKQQPPPAAPDLFEEAF